MLRSFVFTLCFLYMLGFATKPVEVDKVAKESKPSKEKFIKLDYNIIAYPDNDTRIYSVVRHYGYDDTMAKLIVAQARHESGGYKSRLFRKGNNAFGLVKHRGDTLALPTLLTAEGRLAYASYRSLEESTLAVIDFLKRKKCPFKFENVTDYSKWLKRVNYYEAPVELYITAMRIHYKAVSINILLYDSQDTSLYLYDALQWRDNDKKHAV